MDIQLAVRVMLFGFYIFVGLALSVISVIDWTSVVPDLCFSTFSLAVFAIFGSQRDILRVWKNGLCCCFIRSEQDSRRTASHVRTGSVDPYAKHNSAGGNGNGAVHNPYWYRHADRKDVKDGDMADLATLHTRHTNTQVGTLSGTRSPYNSYTDFQFQYESDVGLGLVGSRQNPTDATGMTAGDLAKNRAEKKNKDAWWGAGKSSNRPGTGGSSKQQRPGTAGSNFGETSLNWYPDLGYDFDPEGTSHTADEELELDVATGSSHPYHPMDYQQRRQHMQDSSRKGHANEHTRHSSATVPSEYIGTSPRSPEFSQYESEEAAQSLPRLVSSLSPTPLLPKETGEKASKPKAETKPHGKSGLSFPAGSATPSHAHAPTVNSRLHIEHHAESSTDTTGSISNPNDSQPYLPAPRMAEQHRDSTDGEGGLPAYYLRQHSHGYMHSTDYRSSADSSIGGGARAVMNYLANNPIRGGDPRAGVCVGAGPGPTKLYDSDYPYAFDYTHSNMSTAALDHQYAPPPKSAFEREGTNGGFEFISGRKRTGEGSGDSFQTNPSLYGGRGH